MPAKLHPAMTLPPMTLTVEFRVNGFKHTVTFEMSSRTYYREFSEAIMRGIYNELDAFLRNILKPAAKADGTPNNDAAEVSEKTT